MRYRQLKGLKLSEIGIGCYSVSGVYGRKDIAEFRRLLVRAYERGVTLFDTAEGYGDAEQILGESVRPFRDDVIVATKVGVRGGSKADLSPAYVTRACEGSLRRIQTDVIDLYQVHCAVTTDSRNALLPFCRQHHLPAIAFSTAGRGLLTGRYDRAVRALSAHRPASRRSIVPARTARPRRSRGPRAGSNRPALRENARANGDCLGMSATRHCLCTFLPDFDVSPDGHQLLYAGGYEMLVETSELAAPPAPGPDEQTIAYSRSHKQARERPFSLSVGFRRGSVGSGKLRPHVDRKDLGGFLVARRPASGVGRYGKARRCALRRRGTP